MIDEQDNDCRRCDEVAPWLFVPLVGPFIGMSKTDDGDWGLWFLGMVEAVGAGLMVGGIIRYQNTKRASEAASYSWDLSHDRKLTLDMSTSSRMVGPRLRLAF